jgi:hypothetical protein
MNTTIEPLELDIPEQTCVLEPLDPELEFLWEDRDESGKPYDVYLGRISRNPVVRSHATGKYFMLPWSKIIELAQEHGIDQR